jgi:hypothetical protein
MEYRLSDGSTEARTEKVDNLNETIRYIYLADVEEEMGGKMEAVEKMNIAKKRYPAMLSLIDMCLGYE